MKTEVKKFKIGNQTVKIYIRRPETVQVKVEVRKQ